MCQAIIRIASKSLEGVSNAKLLLKIEEDMALFIQTMEVRLTVVRNAFLAPDSTARAGAIPPLC